MPAHRSCEQFYVWTALPRERAMSYLQSQPLAAEAMSLRVGRAQSEIYIFFKLLKAVQEVKHISKNISQKCE